MQNRIECSYYARDGLSRDTWVYRTFNDGIANYIQRVTSDGGRPAAAFGTQQWVRVCLSITC